MPVLRNSDLITSTEEHIRKATVEQRPEESERANHRDTWGGIQVGEKVNAETQDESSPNILKAQPEGHCGWDREGGVDVGQGKHFGFSLYPEMGAMGGF